MNSRKLHQVLHSYGSCDKPKLDPKGRARESAKNTCRKCPLQFECAVYCAKESVIAVNGLTVAGKKRLQDAKRIAANQGVFDEFVADVVKRYPKKD